MMFRLALRLHRWGMLGYAAIGVLTGVVNAAFFSRIAGSSPAERAAFGQEVEVIGRQVSYLLPLPIRADTLGGYLQWRVFGFMPLLFAIWAVLAGTAVLRGEEERGLLEQWLAASLPRIRLALIRFLAFTVAAAAALAVVAATTQLGAVAAGESLSFIGLCEQCLAILATTMVFFSLGLLVAQLVQTRRAAAGWTAAAMIGLFLVNSLSRTGDTFRPYRWLSPFSYYDRSNALIPDGQLDVGATAGLVAVAIVLALVAAAAFTLRDLGAALVTVRRPPPRVQHLPSRNPLLAMPVISGLYEHRIGLAAWSAGLALLGFTTVQPAKQVVDAMASVPGFGALLPGSGSLLEIYVGSLWFGGVAALLLAAYAITQVARWAADDAEGRLEMTLSAPCPRWRVVAERAVTLIIGGSVVIAVSGLAVALAALSQDIQLNPRGFLLASIMLIPFMLTFGALGAAIASFRPRLAVVGLSAFAFTSYLILFFGPLFKLSDWVLDFSVFKLYGAPMTEGVYQRGLYILLSVTFAGFLTALVAMRRREVGH